MAWIESHQSLQRHPKVITAAALLKISRVQLIGHLHCLWWWALDIASPDGCLGDNISPEMLADVAEWNPVIIIPNSGKKGRKNSKELQRNSAEIAEKCADNAKMFVNALLNCGGNHPGFLEKRDGKLYLHDWWDYGGKLTQKRLSDKERKRKERKTLSNGLSTGQALECRSDGAGREPYTTLQDTTLQDRTGQDPTTTPPTPPPTGAPGENGGGGLTELLADEEGIKEIFISYQKNIGVLTEIIRDQLLEEMKYFNREQLLEAIAITAKGPARTYKYLEGVLKRMERGLNKGELDPDRFIKGKYGHMVQR